MRAATILVAFTFAVLTLACGSGGQPTKSPKKPITVDTLPWTAAEATQNLKGMTKEEVIALFGKPTEVVHNHYHYDEPKYLKPDIGDRDQTTGGMSIFFHSDGTAGTVSFRRR